MKFRLLLAFFLIISTTYSQRLHPKYYDSPVKGLEPPTNLQALVSGSNVQLNWQAPGGTGSEEELVYDHNEVSGSYSFTGYTMSTHMSPAQDCQVLKIKFYTTNNYIQFEFKPKIYDWTGSQPGTTLLYSSTQNSDTNGWVEFDISAEGIFPEGDFVVGFGSILDSVYLGYDADYNNGRSWDLDESSNQWYTYTEAYLIRATVLYPTGDVVELGGKVPELIKKGDKQQAKNNTSTRINTATPINNLYRGIKGFLGYSVFRDGTLLNSNPVSQTFYYDNDLPDGTYTYTVKAVYDEGLSDPAGPATISVPGSNLPPPLNLGGTVMDDQVNLWWVNPNGGTVEELIYDNNEATDAYKFPGVTMSTKMSPAHPCQVLKIKYFTTEEGDDDLFDAKVFGWEGSMPGNYAYFKQEVQGINQTWVVIDVEESNLYFDGDFVVGFGSFTEDVFLGYDINLDNDRSWDYNEATQTWTSWDEAYLIRAVVRYGDESIAELGVSMGLLGYNVYRNGVKLNTNFINGTEYTDILPSYGDYNYNVTALYDEGESGYSNTVNFTYYLGIKEESQRNIKIYPNPANAVVKIESAMEIDQIRILDLNGKVYMAERIMSKQARLNISHLSTGIYLFDVSTENGTFTRKVLVK